MNVTDTFFMSYRQKTHTLCRQATFAADVSLTPVNEKYVQIAEELRGQYQDTLNAYPVPEVDDATRMNMPLFELSIGELPAGAVGYAGEMMCLPSLVAQVLLNNGTLQSEAIDIDGMSEKYTCPAEVDFIASLAFLRPSDGCLYFDILVHECMRLGIQELHTGLREYERLWGRTDQLEILAILCSCALFNGENFLSWLQSQHHPQAAVAEYWQDKPELYASIDDYIFFAFSYQWLTWC